jgi:sulfur-oxidizing protein SoxY
MNRRNMLQGTGGLAVLGLAVAAGLIKPGQAFAQQGNWNKAAFDTKSLPDVVKALGGSAPTESKDIQFLNTPDIAENGRWCRSPS